MDKRKYEETVALMQVCIMRLVNGSYTIGECEQYINEDIAKATMDIAVINERLEAIRQLKRKSWRLLLDATRNPIKP